jgi:hypothetical protein
MLCYAEGAKGRKGKRATPGIPQKVVTIHSKINHVAWRDKGSKKMMEEENKKNNGYDYAMLCYAMLRAQRGEKAKEQHQGFHRRWLQFIPK